MNPLSGGEAVERFLSVHSEKLHISQATARRATARVDRKDAADEGLSVDQIQQDEATRAPANARKARRNARAARRKGLKRAERLQARRLVLQRRYTPAPSRGAARLATRLIAEREAAKTEETDVDVAA